MAVLQRISLLPNARLDTPDARSLEAFGLNDWRFFTSGFFSPKSQILQGFEIFNYSTIFTVPGLSITIDDVVLFHPEATTQAAGFYVFAGTEPNQNISLAPNSTNFIEADLVSISDVPDVRAFWDAAANGGVGQEFTDTVDTVINLNVTLSSNITSFTPGKIPLYKVTTSSSNVVTSISDCRNLFFRLGSGGNTPNPNHNYSWLNLPDSTHARFETPNTATSATATNAIFQGGDKNISCFKDWMDAVMSSIKEVKGTQYWYQPGASGGGVPSAYQNSALTILVGGIWEHLADPSPAGHLALIGGSTCFRLGFANSLAFQAFTDLDLTTYPVLWILLPIADVAVTYVFGQDAVTPVIPKAITALSSNSISVDVGGNYIVSGGSILIRGSAFTYTSYTAGTGLFAGVTPDPSGLSQISDLVYQNDSGGNAYYHYSSSADVPGVLGSVSEGAERVMWLALYDGVSVIQLHNGDLQVGEEIKVGDNTSLNLLQYVGSPNDADSTPDYSTQAVGSLNSATNYNAVAGENLTTRLSKVTSMVADKAQDRNLRFLRSGIGNIVNTTNGIYQDITFTGTTPVLNVIIPGSANNMTIGLAGTIALAANQCAYVTINRNSIFNVADLSGVTVTNITSLPISENTLLVAARLTDYLVYLWDGERVNIGSYPSNQPLSANIWQHLGILDEDSHEPVSSTNFINDTDSYPEMISNLDNVFYEFQNTFAVEENTIVGPGGTTTFTASSIAWSADNTLLDIQVYINGRKVIQDVTGGNNEDYNKTDTTHLAFSFTVPQNARITVRNERTGGSGNWSAPVSAHLIPNGDDLYDIGSPSRRFRNLYVAGKATIVGGIDPAYIELTPQSDQTGIPTNSLWIDANDSNNLKIKQIGGASVPIGSSGNQITATNYLVKIMQNNSVTAIPAGSPCSKMVDGSIVRADSNLSGGQTFIGISVASIAPNGGLGAILLGGPSAEGVLTGLGFTSGDTIYVSETGGYTNDTSTFSGPGDSYIQVGIADCATGVASPVATDLIMMPQILLRP